MTDSTDEIQVLHVDDELDFADLTAEFLEREDERISIQTAKSADDGLKQLSESRVDCIVSDYDMPTQNGIGFLETVRKDYPDLPFILFTGKGSEAVASEAIRTGVSDYLQKKSGKQQYELLANRTVTLVEKYRTEQELDKLRRQFTKLVDQNFVGIYIIQDGEFVYVNPRLADIHGYDDPEEIIGMSPLELVAPEERERVQSNLEQRLLGEVKELQYQTVGLTNDGDLKDIELHGSHIELDGEPAVIGAVADITDRLEREQELKSLHDVAIQLDHADTPQDVYDTLIQAAEDVFAFDLAIADSIKNDKLVPRAVATDLPEDSYYEETPINADDNLAAAAYRTGDSLIVDDLAELEITPADPDYRSALTVPIGEYGIFQAVSKDVAAFVVHDLELAEQLCRHARVELARLERDQALERERNRLENFASVVSHDLRNPLTVAEGRLELAREDCETPHLDDLANAHERMKALIDDLLNLARQGQAVGELESVHLTDVGESCWENVPIDDATIKLKADQTIRANRNRLQQLLENLMRNAVEHGGDGVTLTVGPLRGGFYVEDNGPGIPEEERKDVLKPAYSTEDDGTGFGLSIVKEIVEAHGWDMAVNESESGGARFEFTGVEVVK